MAAVARRGRRGNEERGDEAAVRDPCPYCSDASATHQRHGRRLSLREHRRHVIPRTRTTTTMAAAPRPRSEGDARVPITRTTSTSMPAALRLGSTGVA
jgi:hypothetical protein